MLKVEEAKLATADNIGPFLFGKFVKFVAEQGDGAKVMIGTADILEGVGDFIAIFTYVTAQNLFENGVPEREVNNFLHEAQETFRLAVHFGGEKAIEEEKENG